MEGTATGERVGRFFLGLRDLGKKSNKCILHPATIINDTTVLFVEVWY